MATQRIPGANLPESGTSGSRRGRSSGEAGTGASSTMGATGQANTSFGEGGMGSSVGAGGNDAFGTTGAADVQTSIGLGDMVDSSHTSDDRQFAVGVMDKVKQQASTRVSEQKARAAEGLGSVAAAIRQASEHMRTENQTLAAYADKAVDQMQLFADRIRDKDPAEMMRDLEQFARRNPTAFVGGAFLLGLGLARFLKSSASSSDMSLRTYEPHAHDERREFSSATGTTGAARNYGRADGLSGSSVGVTSNPAPGITS